MEQHDSTVNTYILSIGALVIVMISAIADYTTSLLHHPQVEPNMADEQERRPLLGEPSDTSGIDSERQSISSLKSTPPPTEQPGPGLLWEKVTSILFLYAVQPLGFELIFSVHK